MSRPHLAVPGSKDERWRTPAAVYAGLHAEFAFTLDPCPSNPESDGLAIPWAPARVFLNPPYGRGKIAPWIEKAIAEAKAGALVVALLPSYTGSPWWHDLVIPNATEIRFLRGKLRFGDGPGVAPFWSAVVIFTSAGGAAERKFPALRGLREIPPVALAHDQREIGRTQSAPLVTAERTPSEG